MVDFAFRYTESERILGTYTNLMLTKRCARTVFLARTPLGFGIARMLSMAMGERADLRVVRSDEELNKELSDIRSQIISFKA